MKEEKKFRFKILPEYCLIIESWSGEFTLKEIIEYKQKEVHDVLWNDLYNVLADDRDISINTDFIDDDSDNYLSISQNFIKDRKTAVLTQTPLQVVAPSLMNLTKSPEALVKIEIFSTLTAAIKWLGIDLKESEKINSVLEELKKK